MTAPGDTRDQKPTSPLSAILVITVAGGVAWILGFAALTLTARRLQEEQFGILTFGLAMTASATALLGSNLNVWGSRAIAADQATAARMIVTVNGWQTIAATVLFLVLGAAYALIFSWPTASVLILCNLGFFGTALGLQWVALGLRRNDLVAWNQLISNAVYLVIVAVFVRGPGETGIAPVGIFLGILAGSLVILRAVMSAGVLVPFTFEWREAARQLKQGSVFIYTSILSAVMLYSGSIIVQLMLGATAAGLYGVGARIYLTFLAVPAILSSAMFPRIVAAKDDEAQRRRETGLWITLALMLGGLPAALMVWLPGDVIRLLFQDNYGAAVPAVRGAGVAILFTFAANAYAMAVLARGGDQAFFRGSLTAASIALVGGAAATARYGVEGAAAILALLDLSFLLAVMPAFRRENGSAMLARWAHPIAGFTAVAVFARLPMDGVSPFFRLAMASVIYGVLALPIGELRARLKSH